MSLPRLHLFEFEDMPWFPASLRALHTDNLQFAILNLGFYDPASARLTKLLADSGRTQVVDLCSGATGPWKRVGPLLAAQVPDAEVVFTDLFPHTDAFEATAAALGARATWRSEPVDARHLPDDLAGVRSLFTSFHHFAPDQARSILASAHDAGAPIAVFEYTERTLFNLFVTLIGSSFGVAWATVATRPVTLARLFWTFVVPVLPFVMTWDGLVSQMRSYTVDELHELVKGLDGFIWEIGHDPIEQPKGARMTWLTGRPRAS